MTQPNHYVTCREWQRISRLITFRIDYFFRTIGILTMTTQASQNDTAAQHLRLMVAELTHHDIFGGPRLKSWMHWHLETAWYVFSCFPKTRVHDARAEWECVTRPDGEFSEVAGALYALLAEVQGPEAQVFRERSAEETLRMMDLQRQPWRKRPRSD